MRERGHGGSAVIECSNGSLRWRWGREPQGIRSGKEIEDERVAKWKKNWGKLEPMPSSERDHTEGGQRNQSLWPWERVFSERYRM